MYCNNYNINLGAGYKKYILIILIIIIITAHHNTLISSDILSYWKNKIVISHRTSCMIQHKRYIVTSRAVPVMVRDFLTVVKQQ